MGLLRRRWLQILLSGIVLLILVERTLIATSDPNYAPSVILLGAFLVPVTFVTYLYERLPSWDVSLPALAVCFLWGGVLGTVVAGTLEFDVARALGFLPQLAIGLIEESAKLIVPLGFYFFGRYRSEAARTGEEFVPFDPIADYDGYVDGKPRYEGVRSFLAARGIELAEGEPGDPPDAETVRGLGDRKNEIVLRMIHERGVQAYEGSVRYLEAARDAGLRRAVVSSSANTRDVLVAAGIEGFFEARIDGVVAEREGLKGKPAPDTFLAGARALDVAPTQAAVFEDALAGVTAGRAGGFACVVGVDRVGQAEALREHGASIVVSDLSELLGDR